MLALLAPILVFGLVIFVHELGHFLAAKAVGVYAPRFSIGFGPTLWRYRRGETEYVLGALPLGGYVRMASRHDDESAFIEGGSEEHARKRESDPDYDPQALLPFGPNPVPENRLFENKPLAARLLIMVAGVSMNALLAVAVATGLALHLGRAVITTTVVGAVRDLPGAPALRMLQVGDTVLRVGGRAVSSWNAVRRAIADSRRAVTLTTRHGDVRIATNGPGEPSTQDVAAAIDYFVTPVIDSLIPGERAIVAGFQRGDSIVSIDGRAVRDWDDIIARVSSAPNRPLTFRVARRGVLHTLAVTPRPTEEVDAETGERHTIGKMGAGVHQPLRIESLALTDAVSAGSRVIWAMSVSIIDVIERLVAGRMSMRQLGGPIAITRASVAAARSGLENLLTLIAFLSINVAILNLLPIPILDGGQIVINVIESAKGSPFSVRTREYIIRFGLVAIALLFAVVMYNDTRDGLAKVAGWVSRLFG